VLAVVKVGGNAVPGPPKIDVSVPGPGAPYFPGGGTRVPLRSPVKCAPLLGSFYAKRPNKRYASQPMSRLIIVTTKGSKSAVYYLLNACTVTTDSIF